MLVERPLWPAPAYSFRRPTDENIVWHLGLGVIEGPSVYVDGSLFDAARPSLAVTGWPVISIADPPGSVQRRINARTTGTIADPASDIDGAELMAVIVVIRSGRPPLHAFPDSDVVALGISEQGGGDHAPQGGLGSLVGRILEASV